MTEHHALLFTDIVDSTMLSERLGDEAASQLWQAHQRAARDLLRIHRGREIDSSDGFLLLFADASDAVDYALAYHRSLAALSVPVKARAGLHVGPVALRENTRDDVVLGAKAIEVDGIAKAIAARVVAIAQGGQTLLTAEARQALTRKDVRVESHRHWRLKGSEQPIELFEVGDRLAPFLPPLDSAKAYRVVRSGDLWVPSREIRHSLPAERDSFIGRQAVLLDLARRLDGGTRLVSLLGPGGVGKTRLAQRFAWTRLGDFPGGVWFCDLSQARSLDGISHAVAQGLDVPLGQIDPITQLGNALAGREACLVILDNFEQVVGHAEETLGRWLERAGDATFIVTSREMLGIAGEEIVQVDTLDASDAAELFQQRATAARGHTRSTAEDKAAVDPLVRLLDGLPLAIELAAARATAMPTRTLLRRMNERFDLLVSRGTRRSRQATLRAAFDWSWELLQPAERAALAQLSVFEGSFRLEAAEAVVDLAAFADARSTADVIQSLAEKSLLRCRTDERFELLVSLRAYAAEHLAAQGRFEGSGVEAVNAAKTRHCIWYSSLAEAVAVADSGIELDNLIEACKYATSQDLVDETVGALEGTWAVLRRRGPFKLGVELAASACALPDLAIGARARLDLVHGWALRACGRLADAAQNFESAVSAATSAGDVRVHCRALSLLGDLHRVVGDVERARADLTKALALAHQQGDLQIESDTFVHLGNLGEATGRLDEARTAYEAALRVARQVGDRRLQGGALGNLAVLLANEGKMNEARSLYEEAIAVAREVGDRQWEGDALCNLGLLHQVQGRLSEARHALHASLQVADDMGYVRLGAFVNCNLGIVREALHEPVEARAHYDRALEGAREVGDRRSEGQFLGHLGLLQARQGKLAEADRCFSRGEQLLSEVSDRLNLGGLNCSWAEAAHLSGNRLVAIEKLDAAVALALELGAQAESELGLELARVSAMLLSEEATSEASS